jgi:hypothetical protein
MNLHETLLQIGRHHPAAHTFNYMVAGVYLALGLIVLMAVLLIWLFPPAREHFRLAGVKPRYLYLLTPLACAGVSMGVLGVP